MALSAFFVDPFFTEADRTMDSALHSMFRNDHTNVLNGLAKAAGVTKHAVDVIETKDVFKVVTDAPGFTAEDIKVEVHDNKLTISGEHKVAREQEGKDGKYHVQERQFSKFTRQFQLPKNVQDDSISANLDKGVLTVTVPKRQEPPKPEPKRIAVVAADS